MSQRWSVTLGIVCLAMFCFSPLLDNGFQADDYWLLTAANRNAFPVFTDWAGVDSADASVGPSTIRFFRPLTILTLAAQLHLHGPSAVPFHVLNILLHCINGVLLLQLTRRVFLQRGDGKRGQELEKKANRTAVAVTMLFLFHPLVVYSVGWISGRTDLLALLFMLLAALGEFGNASVGAGRRRAAVAAFIAALLSKETALIFLPAAAVMYLINGIPQQTGRMAKLRSLLRLLAPYALIAVLYLAFRALVIPPGSGTVADSMSLPEIFSSLVRMSLPLAIPCDNMSLFFFGCSHPAVMAAAVAFSSVIIGAFLYKVRAGITRRVIGSALWGIGFVFISLVIYIPAGGVGPRVLYAHLPFVILFAALCLNTVLEQASARQTNGWSSLERVLGYAALSIVILYYCAFGIGSIRTDSEMAEFHHRSIAKLAGETGGQSAVQGLILTAPHAYRQHIVHANVGEALGYALTAEIPSRDMMPVAVPMALYSQEALSRPPLIFRIDSLTYEVQSVVPEQVLLLSPFHYATAYPGQSLARKFGVVTVLDAAPNRRATRVRVLIAPEWRALNAAVFSFDGEKFTRIDQVAGH